MGVSWPRSGQELIRHDAFSDSGRYGTFPRKKAFVAAVSDAEKTTRNAFAVVVNDRGQHALWQAELELPAGWRRQSAALPRQAGLDALAGARPGITPGGGARERGAEGVRSLLAIMKAGCGYLPLDPSLPANRLARICEEARPMAILAGPPTPQTPGETPAKLPRKFSGAGTRLLAIGDLGADLARQPVTAPEVSLHPDTLCYA